MSMTVPAPFTSMPLTYERAYGGWDRTSEDPSAHRMESLNPVGTGFAIREAGAMRVRLPNVEHPDRLISSWKHRPAPAGFGVIASYWSPRRELAGTYDKAWQEERFPLWAADYDDRFNQCAPVDQQVAGYLRGGEAVELVNVTPEGHLGFTLPKVHFAFTTSFGRKRVEHRAKLHTVIIEPDDRRLVLVWLTSLECDERTVDHLDETAIVEKRYI
jgi:hypothetical protein